MPALEEGAKIGLARQEFVQSIARGFSVIKAFASGPEGLTIAEVARRTQLSRAVSRRFLLTLQQLGYVTGDAGLFRLTPRVLGLGHAFLSAIRLPDLAEPVMEEVVSTLHESCSVSVLDGADIVYVARVPSKRIMSVNLAIGSRLPAFATSMGRVLLSELPQALLDEYLGSAKLEPLTEKTVTDPVELRHILAVVRERGWAQVDQEVELGVRSVAADPGPPRTGGGRHQRLVARVARQAQGAAHAPPAGAALGRGADLLDAGRGPPLTRRGAGGPQVACHPRAAAPILLGEK
jgi:IclR family pca regulon transcriptional regulator